MTTSQQVDLILSIVRAVEETIQEAGEMGAPESSIYLALQEHGCSLESFEAIVGAMVEAGRVRRDNHVLYYVGGTR